MVIKQIPWQDTIIVRHAVLWPDKDPQFCHVPGDENAIHFGGYINGSLTCVASIFIHNKSARLRKFATYVEHQGKGYGSTMLTHILNGSSTLC